MAVTITVAGLRAAFPEWTNSQAAVVAHAVAVANARPLGLYLDRSVSSDAEEEHRRYLEAGSYLYRHPYARDMRLSQDPDGDPYRAEADLMDISKGRLYRAPGWPDPGVAE